MRAQRPRTTHKPYGHHTAQFSSVPHTAKEQEVATRTTHEGRRHEWLAHAHHLHVATRWHAAKGDALAVRMYMPAPHTRFGLHSHMPQPCQTARSRATVLKPIPAHRGSIPPHRFQSLVASTHQLLAPVQAASAAAASVDTISLLSQPSVTAASARALAAALARHTQRLPSPIHPPSRMPACMPTCAPPPPCRWLHHPSSLSDVALARLGLAPQHHVDSRAQRQQHAQEHQHVRP